MNTKIKIATVMLSLSCATMAVTMDDVGAVKWRLKFADEKIYSPCYYFPKMSS